MKHYLLFLFLIIYISTPKVLTAYSDCDKTTTIPSYETNSIQGEKGQEAVACLEKDLSISIVTTDNTTSQDWDLEEGTASQNIRIDKSNDILGLASLWDGFTSWVGSFFETEKETQIQAMPMMMTCGGAVGGTAAGDDYDGDGYCNDVDLDADNDGILDTNEGFSICDATSLTYLWTGIRDGSRDRGAPNDLNRDFVFGDNFSISLSFNGDVHVIIETTIGDQDAARSGIVTVDGVSQSVSTSAGVFQTVTHTPEIDYLHTINMQGSDISVTSIVVRAIDNTILAAFDFGTPTSPVSSGYIGVHESTPFSSTAVTCPNLSSLDTDNDNVPDYLDLDSDGDGCTDAEEGSGSFTIDGGDIVNSMLTGGVDLNGIPTVATSNGQSIGNSQNASTQSCPCLFATGIDSDGDGLDNSCDLDDDNDGILDTDEGFSICDATSLGYLWTGIRDGSRDRGAPNDLNRDFVFGDNFSISLSFNGDVHVIIETTIGDQDAARSGNVSINGVSQSVSTSAGVFQTVTHTPEIDYLYDINMQGNGISVTSIVVKAIDNTILAAFDFGTPTSPVSSGYIGVHESTPFSSTAVTCPNLSSLDTDNDNVPDYLDLDSDGDGCTDAEEGSGSFTIDGGDIVNSMLTGGVDLNGIPTVATSNGQSIGNSQNASTQSCPCLFATGIDSDGDGLDNSCDLDADNDGILDTNEGFSICDATSLGYLWTGIRDGSRDRGAPNDLNRDFVFGDNFSISLSFNGDVHVIIETTIGDQDAARSGNVSINGVSQSVSTSAGVFQTVTHTPEIDYLYDINMQGNGISVTSIVVKAIDNTILAAFDFGTPTSPVSSGYIGVHESTPFSSTAVTCPNLSSLDTDNDNVPDYLDLDSDGDGCTDAEEGSGSFTIDGGDIVNSMLTGGVDLNGIPTVATSNGQSIGNSQNASTQSCPCLFATGIDSDGDGLDNSCDLDADNDGILDTNEGFSICDATSLGYLWTGIRDGSRDRGAPNDLNRDFVFGDNFSISLSFNGDVHVIIETTIGDQDAARSGNVSINGVSQSVSTSAGVFQTVTHTPEIDYLYDINMQGNGISVTSIVVKAIDNTILAAFDFGTPTSPVSSGYIGVHESTPFSSTAVTCPNLSSLDTDNDNVPDYLDLDSDGDGCTDAEEGSGSFTIDGGDIVNSMLTGGVDLNGIPTVATSNGQSIGNSQNASTQSCPCLFATGIDSDGDGLDNSCDLDDDNDGILDTNEGFSICDATSLGYLWTGIRDGSRDRGAPNDLNRDFVFGDNFSISLSFNGDVHVIIETTIGDQDAARSGNVSINGVSQSVSTSAGVFQTVTHTPEIDYLYDINMQGNGISVTSIVVKAIDNTILAAFDFGTPTSPVSSGYIGVHESTPFSSTAVTCPNLSSLDTDNDNVPDYLDLDSDGDGCTDAEEGSGSFTIDGGDIVNSMLTGGVDLNGIPTVATSNGQSIGNSQNASTQSCPCLFATGIDSDGDGLDNSCDLDADNDGILDTNEGFSICDATSLGYLWTGIRDGSRDRGAPNDLNRDFVFGDNFSISLSFNGDVHVIIETTIGDQDAARSGNVSINGVSQSVSTSAGVFQTVTHTPEIDYLYDINMQGNGISVTSIVVKAIDNTILAAFDFGTPTSPVSSGYIGVHESTPFSSTAVTCPNLSSLDTDNDNVPDYLDLDSDNDGCPDAIEGDGSFTYTDLQNDALTGGVDVDGIPTVATSSGQGVGSSIDAGNSACVEICDNGIDDDGDGDIDSADSECCSAKAPTLSKQ